MLDIYNQFRDFHVFKRFKYLLADWWNIDILIVVKENKKFFYDNTSQLSNPVVKELMGVSLFKNYFLSSINSMIKGNIDVDAGQISRPWKQTGLNLFIAPLGGEDSPMKAFLVATGFAPQKQEKLYHALSYLGLAQKAIVEKVKNLKKLSATDKVYIQKMLDILAGEFFFPSSRTEKARGNDSLSQQKKNQTKLRLYNRQISGYAISL